MRSLYYRYCWHRVSNLLFARYRHRNSSRTKAVYNTNTFILHAASLHQTFVHCGIFSTAASRRSLGSVSVPMLGAVLSHPLPVIALVVLYTTNKLIGHRLLQKRPKTLFRRTYRVLFRISPDYSRLLGKFLCITNPFAVGLNPLDLHALSTPPAFILSQDQTLNKNEGYRVLIEPCRMTGQQTKLDISNNLHFLSKSEKNDTMSYDMVLLFVTPINRRQTRQAQINPHTKLV